MPKQAKSQWDFGELFPAEALGTTRTVLSVSEVTARVRRLLEKELAQIWVSGEVTNLKIQSSGHIYFSIKDSSAQLSCVLFKGEQQVERSLLQDGRKVTLGGGITVYEARGQYQLRVTSVELQGLGALQLAFERLKQKLKLEGLFEVQRKRPLPRYPQRIGLVTSNTGAAIRDVLHVIQRRNPALQIVLAPCRVQGEGAALEIAGALRMLNEFSAGELQLKTGNHLDLVLLTRGGGSLEDLWAFNEEILARAIFHSALPVVSAVGHEIDFTISDFVADLRAATPSAAAEIITEGVYSSCQFVSQVRSRIRQLLARQMEDKHYLLQHSEERLLRLRPRRRLEDWIQRLDDLQTAMSRCLRQATRERVNHLRNLADRLGRVRPAALLKQRREILLQTASRFHEQTLHRLSGLKEDVAGLEARLKLLGPEQVLARGYSLTTIADSGAVVRSADAVTPGQRLRTRLQSGEISSVVEGNKS